jgi:NADH-quinone oxidoreductase subunit J
VESLAFWALAAAAVVGALAVVTMRNVFYAAIGLVASLTAVAGLYVTLHADFLAIAQFLIYVGAIAVLIVFAVMMTAQLQRGSVANKFWPAALALSVLLFLGIAVAVTEAAWPPISNELPPTPMVGPASATAPSFADVLFSTYLFPFELAGVLLLVATVGAIVIARER